MTRRDDMRSFVTSLVELMSAVAVTVGFAMLHPSAGFVVGGAFGLFAARQAARS